MQYFIQKKKIHETAEGEPQYDERPLCLDILEEFSGKNNKNIFFKYVFLTAWVIIS